MSPRYCCLILTKDEENTLQGVIHSARAELQKLGVEDVTFVVSDDSQDRTPEVAVACGAKVVRPGNRGLGHAYQIGLRGCLPFRPDRILVLDGDGQADLGEIRQYVAAMDERGADLVTGSRFINGDFIKYTYPLVNRMGIHILSRYLSWATGQKFTDSHGGIRLMSGRVAELQKIHGKHTYVQESILDAAGRGFRVVEVPASWHKREYGGSRVVSSVLRYARRTTPFLLYRLGWIWVARAR